MIQIRPYQQDVLDDVVEMALTGKRRILIQAPTGSGKTIIACSIVHHAGKSKRVLFLAHRRELIWQTSNKLDMYGVPHGIILGQEPYDPTQNVQVSSIQSYHSKVIRRANTSIPPADIVIVDECHHCSSSKTWQDVLSVYPQAFVIGLTATPISRSGKGLGSYFEGMVRCPSIPELTSQGFLVPAKYFVPSIPDLQGLRIRAGDYVEEELGHRMDQPKLIGDICTNWSRICPDRKTIVFGSSVKHSIHIAENFNTIGVPAAHIDGKTPTMERDKIVEDFRNGKIKVLSNCAIFNEGFDCPEASALIFARPTKSLLLYIQVAGRVLRPAEGKKDCFIIDHAGVVYEHGTLDQDWDWKLDYGTGTVSDSTKAARKVREKKRIECKNCKMIYEGRIACPTCGWRPEIRGKPVETYEAYLNELTAQEVNQGIEDRKVWWLGFAWYARDKNYSPGWAAHKFKEKWGSWPPRNFQTLEPMFPPKEVLSWIKYKQIQYAMSQRKNNPLNTTPWGWKLDKRWDPAANAFVPESE